MRKCAVTPPTRTRCSCETRLQVSSIRRFTTIPQASPFHNIPTSVAKSIDFRTTTAAEEKIDFKKYIQSQTDQLVQRSKQASKSALLSLVTSILTDIVHEKQLYLSEDAETRDALLSSFNHMQKIISPTAKQHNIILEFLGRANHFDHMIQQLELMKKEKRINVQSYTTALFHLASNPKQVDSLIKYFEELKLTFPNQVEDQHYAFMIQGLCKSGKLEEAVEVFKEITTPKERSSSISVTPTILIVNNFIQGLNLNNRQHEIPNLLHGMISQFGIKPNQITFDILIETFIETLPNSENLLTHEVFKALIQLQPPPQVLTTLLTRTIARFENPPHSRETSNVTQMDSQARGQLLMNIFEVMKVLKLDVNVYHYSTMMSYFAKTNNATQVLELYKEMEDARIKPTQYIYHSLMIAHNVLGNIDEALNYWKKIQTQFQSELTVKAFTYVLKMLAKHGRGWEELEKMFNEIGERKLEYDVWIFNTMLGALEVLKLPAEETNSKVVQLIEKMKKHKVKPDKTTYHLLLKFSKAQNNPQLGWTCLNILKPKIRSAEVTFLALLMNQPEEAATQALGKLETQTWDAKKIQELLAASQSSVENQNEPNSK